jgi:hypothetical protein
MVHELVPAEELLDRAVCIAELTPEDCLGQYAFTKRACQAAALRDIADLADPLDSELPDGMTSDQADKRTGGTGSSLKACRRTGESDSGHSERTVPRQPQPYRTRGARSNSWAGTEGGPMALDNERLRAG